MSRLTIQGFHHWHNELRLGSRSKMLIVIVSEEKYQKGVWCVLTRLKGTPTNLPSTACLKSSGWVFCPLSVVETIR